MEKISQCVPIVVHFNSLSIKNQIDLTGPVVLGQLVPPLPPTRRHNSKDRLLGNKVKGVNLSLGSSFSDAYSVHFPARGSVFIYKFSCGCFRRRCRGSCGGCVYGAVNHFSPVRERSRQFTNVRQAHVGYG